MNLAPVLLSLELAAWTAALMLPLGLAVGRALAWRSFRAKPLVEAAVALPLVLPPTVLGYYLLIAFNPDAAVGGAFEWLTGEVLAFSFPGLVLASMIFNLPFAVQPMQQAFAAIPHEVREAAWVSGLSGFATLARIELPIAWPGVLAAFVLTFAHTLGEFGVVLMVGGHPLADPDPVDRHLRPCAGVRDGDGGTVLGPPAPRLARCHGPRARARRTWRQGLRLGVRGVFR